MGPSTIGPALRGAPAVPAPRPCAVDTPVVVPGWLLLSVGVALAANVVAGMATGFTIELMSAVSPFAVQVRAHDAAMLNPWRIAVYPLCIGAVGDVAGRPPHDGHEAERRLVLDAQRPGRLEQRAEQERAPGPGTVEEASERIHGREVRR